MSSSRGIAQIPFFFLIGLFLIISTFIFFVLFKVHITSVAVDVDSINRYQEIPTTLLGSTLFLEEDCFKGDGPAGPHEIEDFNRKMCTKHLAFYYTKLANGAGKEVLSATTGNAGELTNNIKTSLPLNCYKIAFQDGKEDFLVSKIECAEKKLNEIYPIPIFLGEDPSVAKQLLEIGSRVSGDERHPLVTWPTYKTCFPFDVDSCKSDGGNP